jgi:hypothetical protein
MCCDKDSNRFVPSIQSNVKNAIDLTVNCWLESCQNKKVKNKKVKRGA